MKTLEVIAATSIEQEIRGRWLDSGAATCAGEGNIDYGIMSSCLAAGATLELDWITPFRPHASLCWSLSFRHFPLRLPEIKSFTPLRVQPQPFILSRAVNCLDNLECQETPIHLLGLSCANKGLCELFASLSGDVERSVYKACQGRGARLYVERKVLVTQAAPFAGWGGAKVCFWHRLVAWLEACVKRFHVSSFAAAAGKRIHEMWHGASDDPEGFAETLRTVVEEGSSAGLQFALEMAQQQHKFHLKSWTDAKGASYLKWLRQASAKGMRPLFRSVKADESVTVRPFLQAPVQERIYLRWRQWFDLWTQPKGVDPELLLELKRLAMEQAKVLPPISLERAVKFFRKMPTKAPGLDGWTCEILHNIEPQAVQAILDFFHHCEREASWPDQMVFALIAMLPKNTKRERPIALLHILYRSWVRLRWHLVSDWQVAYSRKACWDKAVPGSQVLDVALSRLVLGESVRRAKHHLVTLFLDMETFYDRCLFDDIVRSGFWLDYPPVILHQAMLTYLGPRFVQSEGAVCPPIWPSRGVLAGCPAAPSVSKLVVHPMAERIAAKKSVCNLDVWIDDLSLDSVSKSASY